MPIKLPRMFAPELPRSPLFDNSSRGTPEDCVRICGRLAVSSGRERTPTALAEFDRGLDGWLGRHFPAAARGSVPSPSQARGRDESQMLSNNYSSLRGSRAERRICAPQARSSTSFRRQYARALNGPVSSSPGWIERSSDMRTRRSATLPATRLSQEIREADHVGAVCALATKAAQVCRTATTGGGEPHAVTIPTTAASLRMPPRDSDPAVGMLDVMTTDITGAAQTLRHGALRDFAARGDGDGDSGRLTVKLAAPMSATPVPGLLRYALELIGLKARGPAGVNRARSHTRSSVCGCTWL